MPLCSNARSTAAARVRKALPAWATCHLLIPRRPVVSGLRVQFSWNFPGSSLRAVVYDTSGCIYACDRR